MLCVKPFDVSLQPVVDELQSQFRAYEQSQKQVAHILQHWDRARGALGVPCPGEGAPLSPEESLTEKLVRLMTASRVFSVIK